MSVCKNRHRHKKYIDHQWSFCVQSDLSIGILAGWFKNWRGLLLRPQILHIEFNEDQVLVKVVEVTYLRWYKLSSRSEVGLNFCSNLSSSDYCVNALLLRSVAVALFVLTRCCYNWPHGSVVGILAVARLRVCALLINLFQQRVLMARATAT